MVQPGAIALAVALTCPVAWAGSNFADGSYPDPTCDAKPPLPIRPETFETEAQVVDYNAKVATYNLRIEDYFACVQVYVDNAADDIRRIQAKSQAVVDKANE